MPRTRVVNKHSEDWEVYIGRPGPFGNMFKIGPDGNRDEVIAKYKFWFERRLREDPSFRTEVEGLRGKKLGCFCKPLGCHGDVIVDFLERSV